jgi:hypothetical protein
MPGVPPGKLDFQKVSLRVWLTFAFLLVANLQTYRQDLGGQEDSAEKIIQNSGVPPPLAMDLVENIKGMYRLLDLISESGSNGCGSDHFEMHCHPRINPYIL